MTREAISLVLLDDHVVVRQGLRGLLDAQDDLEVVGEAASVKELEGLRLQPRVVVSDLVLPDGRGAEVVKRVRAHFPDAAVLVLTMVDDPADVDLVFAAGASGYLVKGASAGELVEAVRAVADGDDFLQPSLGAEMARWRTRSGEPQSHVSALERLTEREVEVLRLVALGHTNAEIAELQHIAVRTVEAHRSSVLHKLGAKSRAELVRQALKMDLLGGG